MANGAYLSMCFLGSLVEHLPHDLYFEPSSFPSVVLRSDQERKGANPSQRPRELYTRRHGADTMDPVSPSHRGPNDRTCQRIQL